MIDDQPSIRLTRDELFAILDVVHIVLGCSHETTDFDAVFNRMPTVPEDAARFVTVWALKRCIELDEASQNDD